MEITKEQITKEQIKFIRKADKSVVFRYRNGIQTIEFENAIGATLTIEAEFSYVGYGRRENGADDRRVPVRAFSMIHTPSWSQSWLTIRSLLRAGDQLKVLWMANTNGYVSRASFAGDAETEAFEGLYMDEVSLEILRGDTRLTFKVDHSICPDNSARMFKY